MKVLNSAAGLNRAFFWHASHLNSSISVARQLATRTPAVGRTASKSGIISSDEKLDLKPPKGTRDFYPDEMRVRKWLFAEFTYVSEAFGFEQYDSPVLENESLFLRKAGEEIREQLFNFDDKGGRPMSLRPELTPSLCRMLLSRGTALALPIKWYNIGQCWRYERMTRGRRREHYQWNMDIIGTDSMAAEAELLAAVTTFFKRVGMSSREVVIKVNSRQVLQALTAECGVPETLFGSVCVVLDKLEKLPRTEVVQQLAGLGLDEGSCSRILEVMECKQLEELVDLLGADALAVKNLTQIFDMAEGYGYREWLEYDASVVRGLAYYTGTVFEAFDRTGKLRAICGGGRYDKLLGTFGGQNLPMVGFGFGDAVIMELLQEHGQLPKLSHNVQDVVLCMDEGLRKGACSVAAKLRSLGRRVDVVLDAKKMKWAFKHTERVSAQRLVLIGQSEWDKGCVRVKDLHAREESDVRIADLA